MKIRQRERPNIAKNVFIANLFPSCFFARNMKGILINNIKNGKDKGVRKESKREIPVTPPSINPLGIKKLLRPNPARDIPINIRKSSLIKPNIFEIFSFFIG
jgi:hypothetical protein